MGWGIFEKPAEIHFNEVVFFERALIGSIAYHGEFADAISLMVYGRIQVEPCITARLTLDEIASKGFAEL